MLLTRVNMSISKQKGNCVILTAAGTAIVCTVVGGLAGGEAGA
jgi:hypothetical protein